MRGRRQRSILGTGLGLALLAGLVVPGRPASAAFNPNGLNVSLATVGSGFASPILLTNAGDGSHRIFIVEQAGRVRTLAGGPSGTPFLDISSLVLSGGERGLLGLAFHPSFETNGKLFVNYTRKSDGATVIEEYRVTGDPNNIDEAATRRPILAIAQPYANHNGGHLAFGRDGFLYIGMGDGGSGGDPQDRAQNINSYHGKMLRIDVNGTSTGKAYRVPSTNPYVGKNGLDEAWAIGLRNPWRWSFDRITGDLWIADVGQSSWEEVNRSTASSGAGKGKNYGWDDMEGRHCFEPKSGCATSGRILPLVEFAHIVAGDDNCSVTGGYVYHGLRYPKLTGGYFYGDFCSGRIWTVSSAATAPATGVELLNTSLNIVSFGESERGELFVVAQNGTIAQLRESTRTVAIGRR